MEVLGFDKFFYYLYFMKTEKNCKNCNKLFLTDTRELSRGTRKGKPQGLFCSRTCSAIFSNKNRSLNTLICIHCSSSFTSVSKITKFCSDICCIKHRKNIANSEQIVRKSTLIARVNKSLKSGTSKCFICDWDKTVCDIHHIIPKSKGGSDDFSNITVLCPNCHRLAHKNLISDLPTVSSRIGLYLHS